MAVVLGGDVHAGNTFVGKHRRTAGRVHVDTAAADSLRCTRPRRPHRRQPLRRERIPRRHHERGSPRRQLRQDGAGKQPWLYLWADAGGTARQYAVRRGGPGRSSRGHLCDCDLPHCFQVEGPTRVPTGRDAARGCRKSLRAGSTRLLREANARRAAVRCGKSCRSRMYPTCW